MFRRGPVARRGWGSGGFAGLALGVLLLVAGAVAVAEDPLPRVARLSYVQGAVTVLRADNTGGDPGQVNMPLTEGQRVATGHDGQAEVEFEDGSLLRVSPESTVLLVKLATAADGALQTDVSVLNGLVYASLRAGAPSGYRLEAGGDVVTPVTNTVVRVMLDQPPAEFAVLEGTAHVERPEGYSVDVGTGESLRGDPQRAGRYFLTQRVEHNSWDDWNEEREQAAANDLAAQTAARTGFAGEQGYGWSDLDANGTWYDTGQGEVWQPFDATSTGFDPYGYGSWVYATGPGYVWSSGYAWGWTPFRCGSWSYWGDFGWGWRPGRGCGVGGWSGGHKGQGNRINLSSVPPGYKRPLPPVVGGPVRVHPIVPVRTGPAPSTRRGQAYEAREIAGQMAVPLRVAGATYTPRGGSAVGSSLRRDYPVNIATGQPVLGLTRMPEGRRPAEAAGAVAGAAGREAHAGLPGTERPGYARHQRVDASGARVQAGEGLGGQTAVGGGIPQNQMPALMNTIPVPLNTVPAPLNTVPRLPSGETSVPVMLPPGQRPTAAPVAPRPVGLPPVQRPAAPPQPVVRPAPSAPAPVRTAPQSK